VSDEETLKNSFEGIILGRKFFRVFLLKFFFEESLWKKIFHFCFFSKKTEN